MHSTAEVHARWGQQGVLGAKHTTGESASLDTHVHITSCSRLPAGKLLLSRHGEWVLLEAPATAPLIRLYKQAQRVTWGKSRLRETQPQGTGRYIGASLWQVMAQSGELGYAEACMCKWIGVYTSRWSRDRAEREPRNGTQAWRPRLVQECGPVAGSRDTGEIKSWVTVGQR